MRTLEPIEMGGPWGLVGDVGQAPRIVGVHGANDSAVGIEVGDVCVIRQPGEGFDALIRRCAQMHGTAAEFRVQYS